MTLVGFKRATIRVWDGSETPTPDTNVYVVEGTSGKGATQKAEISGLSAEPTKAYGSNVAYYISNKGVGDPKVNLTLLDLPMAVEDKLLGYENKEGISYIGEKTEPPYCSILLESETLSGETAYFAFFKGQFSSGDTNMETKKGSQEEPNGDQYTFVPIASDKEGTKGQVAARGVLKEEQLKKLKQQLGMLAA